MQDDVAMDNYWRNKPLHDEISRLEATVRALEAERDALRADAERYRWARKPENASAVYHMIDRGECGANMDARIDDARAQS